MQWTLNPVGSPWLTAVIAGALLLILFTNPQPRPTAARLWSLKLLRLLATLMLLFALLRPTLQYTKTEPVQATLVLLVDISRSMSVEDSLAGKSRWQAARTVLDNSADSLAKLGERWKLAPYVFDRRLTPVTIVAGKITLADQATGDESAIGMALQQVLDREGGERLAGVLLLSDGAQRAVPPGDLAPQIAVRRYAAEGAPLYTFPFGLPGTGERADLAIEDLLASDTVFAQTPTEITGRLRVDGYANRTLTVQLLWERIAENGQESEMISVAAQQIETVPGRRTYPLRLQHTPTEPGEWKISLQVATQEGELVARNNSQSTFITVREGGVKVLQLVGTQRVGGVPGREQRFVRAALAASPDIVVTRRVFNYRQTQLDLSNQLANDPYDVVLIDDLDVVALNEPSWRAIAERIRNGTGLMMMGGLHSFGPGGYLNSPLADVLPITPGFAERQNFNEPLRRDVHLPGPLRMKPTTLGERHPILQLASQPSRSQEVWTALPDFDGANRFETSKLKPNSLILAETNKAPRVPLLVAGQSGAGRTLASAVDSTWRWQMQGQGEAHRRFWRQAMLWLAQKDDTSQSPVRIELASRRVPRGASLDMVASIRVDDGVRADTVRYEATVTKPDGTKVDLPLASGTTRATTSFSDTRLPGDYLVSVTGTQAGKELGTATARFLAPEQDLELDNPAAEPALMSQLAATTSAAGGRSLAPEELPNLLAELAAKPPEMTEEIIDRITHWDTWPFFLTLVSLLGVEWYLRKRWGLV